MKIIATLLILLTSIQGFAQGTLTLKGKVYDNKTRNELPGATIQLMKADSTIIATTTALSEWRNDDQTGETSDYTLTVPRQDATYIIRCSMLGYKTTEMTVKLNNLKKREFIRELPPLLMREESKVLKEVTVSATKVQFYYRGDTVIYNADAFVLAEGSMLDVLVRQLPGVEIRENGDIYHDGRLVEKLMLNGKDFFRSDKKLMLDNLPTYTVKQIEVYDKLGERSEFTGHELPEDKEYVMDVKLKKEYSVGWMANAEAGAGLAEKGYTGDTPYMARLFAMRFTDHSQLAVYANANNLSDERRPGNNDGFKPENLNTGTLTQQLAGVTYGINARNKKWTLSGDANVSHSILHSDETTDRTNFLTSGDTYDHIQSYSREDNFRLSTDNKFEYNFKLMKLTLRHSLLYQHFDNTSSMASETRGDTLLNRYYNKGLTRGHDLKTGLLARSLIKFKDNTADNIEAKASVIYNNRKDDTFKRYDLYLGNASQPTQHADQYYRNHPDRNYTVNASVAYNRQISQGLLLELGYGIEHTEADRNSRLYRLDLLEDYEQGDMGILPSVAEYEAAQDMRNSYESKTAGTDHTITPSIYFYHITEKGRWSGQITMPVTLRRNKLDYERGAIDTTLTRTSALIGFRNTSLYWTSKDETRRFGIRYRLNPQTPDLLNMVNMRDDTDPLNIHEGNSGLKNSYNHSISISYDMNVKKDYNYSWSLDAGLTDNAIAMGYTYDPATGIRTYRAQNVDGNWNIALYNGFKFQKKRLMFSSILNASHQQNADLVGINSGMKRSIVRTEGIGTLINANYTFGKNAIGVKFDGEWKYVNSRQEDFTNLNIWNYNYGLTANLNLPLHLQLATDLTMFSRRGYHDSSLNTDDLVWNARLSYSTMKGNLIFMLDGYDILSQLSNITYTLNGQGRTEVRRNVLPQYVLVHVQYRLNKKPKR